MPRFRLRALMATVAASGIGFAVMRVLGDHREFIGPACLSGMSFLGFLFLARARGPRGDRRWLFVIAAGAAIGTAYSSWARYRFSGEVLYSSALEPSWWLSPDPALWALFHWLQARHSLIRGSAAFWEGDVRTVQWIFDGLTALGSGITGVCLGSLYPSRRHPDPYPAISEQ